MKCTFSVRAEQPASRAEANTAVKRINNTFLVCRGRIGTLLAHIADAYRARAAVSAYNGANGIYPNIGLRQGGKDLFLYPHGFFLAVAVHNYDGVLVEVGGVPYNLVGNDCERLVSPGDFICRYKSAFAL